MTNRIALCLTILAVILTTACSKSERTEITDSVSQSGFAGDPSADIRSKDNKFLCDLQWTPGYSSFDYFSADNIPKGTGELDAKDPWCLIPYGESSKYEIIIKDTSKKHYLCRYVNSNYAIELESDIVIGYDTYKKTMKCAEVNEAVNSVEITAGTVEKEFQDEVLFHILSDKGVNSIVGHANLRLVKPVNLTVLWEPIMNKNIAKEVANKDINKIKNDFKTYMKKVGYYIDIVTVPLVIENNYITLPQERGILESSASIISAFNNTMNKYGYLRELFGADPNSAKIQQANYVISSVPDYYIKYDLRKNKYVPTSQTTMDYSTDPPSKVVIGWCYIDEVISAEDSYFLSLMEGIEIIYCSESDNFDDMMNYGYLGGIKYLETSSPQTMLTEKDCNNVSFAEGNGGSFNTLKGYVLNDAKFFDRKYQGRLLASLLYSKIIGENPRSDKNDGRWLSSYTENSDVEQPMKDWRKTTRNLQQELHEQLKEFIPILEFASNR